MKILLLDFEATDKEPKTARITEIGAMLVDECFNPLGEELNILVYGEGDYPPQSKEVVKITGITDELLKADGTPPVQALAALSTLGGGADYIIAYNKAYDETLFRTEAARNQVETMLDIKWMLTTPWLCAMSDIEQNYEFKSWKQMHVALEYMVPVDPNKLHRAINDVELMRQLLVASKTTPHVMYQFQQSPWIYVVAKVRPPWEDGGKSSTEAKGLGFAWQTAKGDDSGRVFDKRWVKRMKDKDFDKLQASTMIEVRKL